MFWCIFRETAVRGHRRVRPFGFVGFLTNLATKEDNRMMRDDKNASV